MKNSSTITRVVTVFLMAVTLISTTGATFTKKSPIPASPANVQGDNLAIGKNATQSSVYKGGSASRAVDGNTDGVYKNGSVTHTQSDRQAWWQVDLGKSSNISTIEIWPRTDCCEWRSSNLYVLVSDSPIKSTKLNTARSQRGVSSFFIQGSLEKPTTININRSGRYIRVQLSGKDYLSLAEVVVNSPGKATPPVAATPTNVPATPTSAPTSIPTSTPTSIPTINPTQTPTSIPTQAPTATNTQIPTLAPMNTATPANTPTSIPPTPTEIPPVEPTIDVPTAEPTQEQPPVVVDNSSVAKLGWFYNAPYPENEALVAEKFDTFYLSIDADYFRDRVRNTGKNSPIVFYMVFNAIFDMSSCEAQPNLSTAAYLPGDFCRIDQEHPDWFLLDTAGNRIMEDFGNGKYLVYMDPSNPGWREFWLERASMIMDQGWNGVFMDNMDGGLARFRRLGQIPAKYPDEDALQADYSNFAAYVANAYFKPNGYKLMANITETSWSNSGWMRYLDNLDGMMEEGFGVDWESGYLYREQWEYQLNNFETLQANGKEILYVAQGNSSDQGRQAFAYGSYMLVANGLSTFRYTHYNSYEQPWLYDNYSLVLGTPLGARYQEGSDWVRDFANGKIIVNPDAHTAVFQMNQ